jgi:hypothetical protein
VSTVAQIIRPLTLDWSGHSKHTWLSRLPLLTAIAECYGKIKWPAETSDVNVTYTWASSLKRISSTSQLRTYSKRS